MGTTKAQARDCVLAPLLTKKSKMADAPVERLSPKHPDWIWLQSPAEQLMAERSVQFDPKTECWVADPDEVYIRGKITSAGDTCEVQTAKETLSLPKAEVFDCNPPKFEKAAAALVEKRELWSTISACKFTASNHQAFL